MPAVGAHHPGMHELVWALWLLWNVATLLVFGFDKWRSRGEGRRIRERTLLWWMAVGGWLGGWLAMAWFRHKTVKQPFRRWAITWTLINPTWLLVWWTFQGRGGN
jgi:uncharacterized membrane protein YsdA (DUF1294 family)